MHGVTDVPHREKSPRHWPRRLLGVGFLAWDRTPNVGIAVGLRLGTRFINESGEDSADVEVVDLAECVKAYASVSVNDHEARSATQLVSAHRDRQANFWVVGVDSNRERYAVLVQKRFE